MPNHLELKMQEILDKKFEKTIHAGYSPEDVDLFFDQVIEFIKTTNADVNKIYNDYKKMQEEITSLKNIIHQKEQTIKTLSEANKLLHDEGYTNMRTMNEMSEMKKKMAEFENKRK
jgi:DivIVA domain-containing protein